MIGLLMCSWAAYVLLHCRGAAGQSGDGKLKYFMVHPFIGPLRQVR